MLTADIIGNLLGIFKVDCILAHTDCKGADRFAEKLCGNRADKRAVKSAAEQKADLGVCVKALSYSLNKLIVYF